MRASTVGRLFALGCLLLSGPAHSANFVIADGDVTALVAAIGTANGNGVADTIDLATDGLYPLAVAAETGNGLPAITAPLTINGHGATIYRAQQAVQFRIMEIRTPATVTLNDLNVTGGDSGGRDSFASRGGNIAILLPTGSEVVGRLVLPPSTVTLNGCLVSGAISGLGGGILVEPDDVHLSINTSFIVGNLASQGAGLAVLGGAFVSLDHSYIGSNSAVGFVSSSGTAAMGGGILTIGPSTINVIDSAISGNETSPAFGSDSSLGGGIADTGGTTYTILRSEMIGNITRSSVLNQGGGIHAASPNGAFTIVNTTFSNNLAGGISNPITSPRGFDLTASHGGAINNEGGSDFALYNVTIARNFAFRGAGVAVATGNGGALTLANTILADNSADDRPDCSGSITSLGYNLLENTSGCTVTPTTGDLVGVEPLLAGANDNGGSTTTHALLTGSPAIDGGDPAGCKDAGNATLTTDQRGFIRPVGDRCDIGAFERGPVVEDCDNCLDDDGDDLIDRDDPNCTWHLDAGGSGLGDAARGKALGACAKALGKAGAKLLAGETKRLQKCVQTSYACLQQKPGDAACIAKAQKACATAALKRQADLAKYGSTVRGKCGPPALATADLLTDAGLGFGHESTVCTDFGASAIATVDDVVTCMSARHVCRAQEMVGLQVPRALELFFYTSSNADNFSCLTIGSDAQGATAGDPKVEGKFVVGCEKAIQKAGGKFASGKIKLAQQCALAVSQCQQEKPGDAKCLPKAQQKCAKAIAKLSGPKGLEAKLAAAIQKGCTNPVFGTDLTLDERGVGYEDKTLECGALLGVGSISSIATVAACVNVQHECRVEQALEAEIPRYRELLTAGGVTLP